MWACPIVPDSFGNAASELEFLLRVQFSISLEERFQAVRVFNLVCGFQDCPLEEEFDRMIEQKMSCLRMAKSLRQVAGKNRLEKLVTGTSIPSGEAKKQLRLSVIIDVVVDYRCAFSSTILGHGNYRHEIARL